MTYEELLDAYELLLEEMEDLKRGPTNAPDVFIEVQQDTEDAAVSWGDHFALSFKTSPPTYTVTIKQSGTTYRFTTDRMEIIQ